MALSEIGNKERVSCCGSQATKILKKNETTEDTDGTQNLKRNFFCAKFREILCLLWFHPDTGF